MRIFASLISALATVFFVGCASGNDLTLGTIGPQLPQPAGVSTATGSLVVYSAFETGAAFNSRNESGQSYSDYKIFTSEGRLLQQVHNDSGTMELSPVAVRLTPGKYTVVAQANGYASVTVPVIIAAHQSTILHLEGGGVWSGESAFNQTNSVRLPDGMVVGWKSGS